MRGLRNLVKSNNVYQNWSLFGSKAQCSTSTQVFTILLFIQRAIFLAGIFHLFKSTGNTKMAKENNFRNTTDGNFAHR